MIEVVLQGQTLKANLLNPEVSKRYEDGFDKVVKTFDEAAKCERGSDGIRMQCQAVIDYVTDIFGEEQAKKVFGESTDLLECSSLISFLNPLILSTSSSSSFSFSSMYFFIVSCSFSRAATFPLNSFHSFSGISIFLTSRVHLLYFYCSSQEHNNSFTELLSISFCSFNELFVLHFIFLCAIVDLTKAR